VPRLELRCVTAREEEESVARCIVSEGPVAGVQASTHDYMAGLHAPCQHRDGRQLVLPFVGMLQDEKARLEMERR